MIFYQASDSLEEAKKLCKEARNNNNGWAEIVDLEKLQEVHSENI